VLTPAPELPDSFPIIDSQRDGLYNYSKEDFKTVTEAKPWKADPNYFKSVRISAVALMKMVMHARTGGELEVMGMMQGYVDGTSFVVTDAFRLPVEGTETRVNAHDEANEYMVQYLELCRDQTGGGGREENVVGWYHSHPGYGCWLSGIDVSTQKLQQSFMDPFAAVVIDPHRTVSSGKVDIGAFRTYPEDYTPPASGKDSTSSIPMNKAADFGAHADKYYSLEVEHFKSSLDDRLLESLWNRYWVQTLSGNPLLTNRDFASSQMVDLAGKTAEVAKVVAKLGARNSSNGPAGEAARALDGDIAKIVADAKGVASKEEVGLLASDLKAKVFKPTAKAAENEDLTLE
jgi:COP9 signalosome complex subunit 5